MSPSPSLRSDRPTIRSLLVAVTLLALTAGAPVALPAPGPAYGAARHGSAADEIKLLAADGATDDEFGFPAALASDAALVGASNEDDNGEDSGSAYVFHRGGSSWLEVAKLVASDGAAGDRFGDAVAIADDLAAVGAPFADGAVERSGAVYLFTRAAGAWVRVESAKLVADDGAENDRFGAAVAVQDDTVAVGAPFAAPDGARTAGTVHVFERDGDEWRQVATLTAPEAAPGDRFGLTLAIAADTLVVGAPFAGGHGAVHLFERTATGWQRAASLVPPDGAAGDLFGGSVAISGATVLVGAAGDDDAGLAAGAAYLFDRGPEGWSQVAKLTASDGASDDLFGDAVSISDGIAVIGAQGDDDNGGEAGAAYLFVRGEEGWEESTKLTPTDGAADDLFGISVSTAGTTALIGAKGDDDNGVSAGAAYVFEGLGG